MDEPKRILFVLDYYYPHVGGGETLFRELASALAIRRWQVTVLTIREPGTAREETLDGVKIVRVTTPPVVGRYWFILLAILPAIRLAAAADILHAGGYASAWAAWLAGWWRRCPRALTVYEVFADQWLALQDVHWPLSWLFRLYERLTLRLRFDRYLCISGFTRDRLVRFTRLPTERMDVVYPAVDYDFWQAERHRPRDLKAHLGLPANSFLCTYFGRPGVSKGVEFLLEATALLRRRLPDSHLLLILSRDPARGYRRVKQRLAALNLQSVVTLLDPVPRNELPSYLLASDCVVVPSLSEGFGYTAVEAATLGCRVIATRGHAVEEVLGDAAVFVPSGDPQALADALYVAATKRSNVSPLPQKYSVRKHVENTVAVYDRLLRRSGNVGRQC